MYERSADGDAAAMKNRFFAAGMAILAEDGYGALKLANLCRHVGVTSGSFYHFFDSWRDFSRQLVENWYMERTARAVELARAQEDPAERVDLLLRLGVSLPHSAEGAIRVWAGIDPEVGAIQQRVDRERVAATTEAIAELTDDPHEASELAHAAFYLLVGFEQATGERDIRALERFFRSLQDRALVDAGAEDLTSPDHTRRSELRQ